MSRRSLIHLLDCLKSASTPSITPVAPLCTTGEPRVAAVLANWRQGAPHHHPSSPTSRLFHTTSSSQSKDTQKETIHITDEVYNRQRSVLPLLNRLVHAAPSAYIAPSAVRCFLCSHTASLVGCPSSVVPCRRIRVRSERLLTPSSHAVFSRRLLTPSFVPRAPAGRGG